jgi:NADP-dependent 3-hydroxy acid dehydrogenase YdfG
MDLSDEVAIVTGASSGIGDATARELAGRGATVVAAARREDRLDDLVADIESDDGDALAVRTDVRDEDDVAAMVEAAHETFGSLDILVNNAGVAGARSAWDATPEKFRQILEVNLLGAMNATSAALEYMLESGSGQVVNVSSTNAINPPPGGGGYNASKAALNAFSDSLRRAVTRKGIRVTVVMPGRVQTEIASWEDWDGRPLQPTDVAEAIGHALDQPARASVNELVLRPTDQPTP